jgi:hypothetical protein
MRQRREITARAQCPVAEMRKRWEAGTVANNITAIQYIFSAAVFALTLIVKAHSQTPLHNERVCEHTAPLTRATRRKSRDCKAKAREADTRDVQLKDEEWQWSDKARESDDTNRETVMRGELGGCRSKRESADCRAGSCCAVTAES